MFYFYLYFRFEPEWADLYLAGYVLEKSLSIDNLMVFVAIFTSFGIKDHLQHRILYWGILGALIFRAIFVVIGTGLFAPRLDLSLVHLYFGVVGKCYEAEMIMKKKSKTILITECSFSRENDACFPKTIARKILCKT